MHFDKQRVKCEQMMRGFEICMLLVKMHEADYEPIFSIQLSATWFY